MNIQHYVKFYGPLEEIRIYLKESNFEVAALVAKKLLADIEAEKESASAR